MEGLYMSEIKRKNVEIVFNELCPYVDAKSEILILGTAPGPKSREDGFYYSDPRNRFWKVLAGVYGEPVPTTIKEKKDLLRRHHIALWDVCNSCEIKGAADSTIRKVVPNNCLKCLIELLGIKKVFLNGDTAKKLYDKHIGNLPGVTVTALPSTSGANTGYSLDDLIKAWKAII